MWWALALAWLVATGNPAHASDEFQTWNYLSLRTLENENGYFVTTALFRLTDDSTDPSLWRIGQAIFIDPVRWMQAGLAYRYSESKNSDDVWRSQHRLEVQLTPRWWLTHDIHIGLRNRLELRWNEGTSSRNERSRHRLRLSIRAPQWYHLSQIYGGTEVIYDYDRNDLTENRLVPLGFLFRLNDVLGLRTYYMLRSIRNGSDWTHVHVLGTGFGFRT